MDREQPIEKKHSAAMNAVAHTLDQVFAGYGWALLVFEQNTTKGRMNYISNSNRADMLRAMREFIAKNEAEFGNARN